MNAEEWLRSKFVVYRSEGGEDRFSAVRAGDFGYYLPNEPDRVTAVDADVANFLGGFGAVISTALTVGGNPVDYLLNLPTEAQGSWGAIFRLWKKRNL